AKSPAAVNDDRSASWSALPEQLAGEAGDVVQRITFTVLVEHLGESAKRAFAANLLDDLAEHAGIEAGLLGRLLYGIAGLVVRLAERGDRLFSQRRIDAELGGHVGQFRMPAYFAEDIVEQRHNLTPLDARRAVWRIA